MAWRVVFVERLPGCLLANWPVCCASFIISAGSIIRTKSDKFDPAMLEDHYRNALVRILHKKQAKRHAHSPAVKPSRENVVSLMDALRRSIAAERPGKSALRGGLDKRATVKRAARHRKAS
jgi:DNA end-binding protein Ku